MRETRFKEGFECPHCSSEHVVRFGKYNGRQRYRYKCCSKTFTDTTNTVLYRTRKGNEWITFVDCMFKGYSLRKSPEIVGVTWVTLFYWRHKLLNALNQMDVEYFEGIVEIWFLFVDSLSNESTKQHIKEFLLTSFVFEMTNTYDSFRLSKFNV
jgi:transposase-like protein